MKLIDFGTFKGVDENDWFIFQLLRIKERVFLHVYGNKMPKQNVLFIPKGTSLSFYFLYPSVLFQIEFSFFIGNVLIEFDLRIWTVEESVEDLRQSFKCHN